jgi:BirA family biotin operon repressor/biotin-[acetyl-CoA-carboxylase] ligase
VTSLGRPHVHRREVRSVMDVARDLALDGAPHGALVTADLQTAGRGRHGRTWTAPAGQALLLALVVREPDPLLSLRAGLAVADLAGPGAKVKWPNDVLLEGLKVAGILVEGRPQEGWAIAGIGVNAAIDVQDLPAELHGTAGTLGLPRSDLDAALQRLLTALAARLDDTAAGTLVALRERDALLGAPIRWNGSTGTGAGITDDGALRVRLEGGEERRLHAGEVHLVGM